MADFFQNGVILTLQKLRERSVEELRAELWAHSKLQRICLILPALVSEFDGPAMPRIVDELRSADFLHRIVLSLDGATEAQFRQVIRLLSTLPGKVTVIWNDGPTIEAFLSEIAAAGFNIAKQGKGRGVWVALGYALADEDVHTIALHDCDIINYDQGMLARLVYPITHPGIDVEFSKGYYARVESRLHGRVTRLFFTPLVRSLIRIQGPVGFLEYLDSFRYGLSGEFALVRNLAKSIRISPTWGLEVSLLGEVFEHTTVHRVCQVEITDTYHHKHQNLSERDPGKGLMKMATDIATTLFGILAQGGMVLSRPIFDTLLATYLRFARNAIEQYNALAQINGLPYDRNKEIEAVEGFVGCLKEAQRAHCEDPIGAPLMCSWVRIRAAIPDFPSRLQAAVDGENA